MKNNNEFYGDGAGLPELHPDQLINQQVLVGDLCAKLDVARRALAGALEMNVVTPAAISMKRNLRWALNETAPTTLSDGG